MDVLVPAGMTRSVRVVLGSYDESYAGQTDVVILEKVGSSDAQEVQRISGVRFGSVRVNASWDSGDTIRTVGHYESRTLKEACEQELTGSWDVVEKECQVGTSSYDAAVTCENAYPNQRLRFNAVYPHGSRCEMTTRAHDTLIVASEGWDKAEQVYTYDPNLGYFVPQWVKREQTIDNGGFDDDGGTGTNAKLTLPTASTDSDSGFIVGLYPWNDAFSDKATPGGDTDYPSDYIRLYRDEALSTASNGNDADRDGISAALESELGLSSVMADTDVDGLIDGMELYGVSQLPLPALGADPDKNTVVIEVDHVEGRHITQNRRDAIRAAGYALDELDIDLISLTGEFAAGNHREECDWVYEEPYGWRQECEDIDVPILPASNITPQIPTTQEDSTGGLDSSDSCDAACLQTRSGFDLEYLPFVKRMAWTEFHDGCGSGFVGSHAARWATVKCDGSSFTHELGHLLQLRHGGHGDNTLNKPNYWSVMNYMVSIPHPDYGGVITLDTKETFRLGYMKARPARFSDGSFIDLDENALDETMGLSGGSCLNGDCSSYTAPVVFEDIVDPNNPGTISSPNWTDLTVRWLNWDGDTERDPGEVEANVNGRCRRVDGSWLNEDTDEIGSKAVCRDVLEAKDDSAALSGHTWTTAYALPESRQTDAQRVAMGLDAPQQSSTYLLTGADDAELTVCP